MESKSRLHVIGRKLGPNKVSSLNNAPKTTRQICTSTDLLCDLGTSKQHLFGAERARARQYFWIVPGPLEMSTFTA